MPLLHAGARGSSKISFPAKIEVCNTFKGCLERFVLGEHNVEPEVDEQKMQAFMKALLDDLRALDYMLDNNLIESGVARVLR